MLSHSISTLAIPTTNLLSAFKRQHAIRFSMRNNAYASASCFILSVSIQFSVLSASKLINTFNHCCPYILQAATIKTQDFTHTVYLCIPHNSCNDFLIQHPLIGNYPIINRIVLCMLPTESP